jgi:hypothetical protein
VRLYWMKTTEAWPGRRWHDSRLESEFTCSDEDKPSWKSDSLWGTHMGTVH